MIIRDDKLDCTQAALFQAQQELLPARLALAIGELHREHLAMTVAVHPNGDQ